MFCFLPVPLQRRPAICCTVFRLPPDSPLPSESWRLMPMPVWPSYRRSRYCVLKMHRICSRSPWLSLSGFRCHTPSSKAVSIHCLSETCRHCRSDSPSRRGHCQQIRWKSGDISKKSRKAPFATVHPVAEDRHFYFLGQVKGRGGSWPRLGARHHWWCNAPSLHARLPVKIHGRIKSLHLRSSDQSSWSPLPCVGSALAKMLSKHSHHWGMLLSFSFPENCIRRQGWKKTASHSNRCNDCICYFHQFLFRSSIAHILL